MQFLILMKELCVAAFPVQSLRFFLLDLVREGPPATGLDMNWVGSLTHFAQLPEVRNRRRYAEREDCLQGPAFD